MMNIYICLLFAFFQTRLKNLVMLESGDKNIEKVTREASVRLAHSRK